MPNVFCDRDLKNIKILLDNNFKTKKSMLIRRDKDNNTHSDIIFTFDIEQITLFLDKDTSKSYTFKQAIKMVENRKELIKKFKPATLCYMWQFSIENYVIWGRFLEDVPRVIEYIKNRYDINFIEVWVHNNGYEFQAIKKLFYWDTKRWFTRKARKPIYITTDTGIKFRDSMILANNMALDKLTDFYNLPVKKLTGSIDYDRVITPYTPLPQNYIDYGCMDCMVLYEFIKHKKKEAKELKTSVKLTSTGEIRHLMKKSFTGKYGLLNQQKKVAYITPPINIYLKLVEAMGGGETHANAYHSNITLQDVMSKDEMSKYPHVMITEKYPSSKWVRLKDTNTSVIMDKIEKNKKDYAFLIDYTIKGDIVSNYQVTKIPVSKVYDVKSPTLDNGRVRTAEEISRITTEVDFAIEMQMYEFDEITINEVYYCKKEYLPVNIVELLISLFKQKHNIALDLKKFPDDSLLKSKYAQIKAKINSTFGCSITNYISDDIELDELGNFNVTTLNDEMIETQLQDLITGERLFLPYAWGVWITAYARRDLWEVILHLDTDIVYYDTDSVKYINHDRYTSYFEELNKRIIAKNKAVADERGINLDVAYNIGIWEEDSTFTNPKTGVTEYVYREFKTLGAKKYCYRNYKGLNITIAGVPKKGVLCLNDDISNFKEGFIFDERAGKKAGYYVEDTYKIEVTDYQGITHNVITNTGIALYDEVYTLGLSKDYQALLSNIEANRLGSISFKIGGFKNGKIIK